MQGHIIEFCFSFFTGLVCIVYAIKLKGSSDDKVVRKWIKILWYGGLGLLFLSGVRVVAIIVGLVDKCS